MFNYENRYKYIYQPYIYGSKESQRINDISVLKIGLYFSIFNTYRNINKWLEEYSDRFSNMKHKFIFSLNTKYFKNSTLSSIENHTNLILNTIGSLNRNKFNIWRNIYDSTLSQFIFPQNTFIYRNYNLSNFELQKLESTKARNYDIFDNFYNISKIINEKDFIDDNNYQNFRQYVLLAEKEAKKAKDKKSQVKEDLQKLKDLFTPKVMSKSNGRFKLSNPLKTIKRSGDSRFSFDRKQSYYISGIVPRPKNKRCQEKENDQDLLQAHRIRSRSECPPPALELEKIPELRSKTPNFNDRRQKNRKDSDISDGLLKPQFALRAKSSSSLPALTQSDSNDSQSSKNKRKSIINLRSFPSFLIKKESAPREKFSELTHRSPRMNKKKVISENPSDKNKAQSQSKHSAVSNIEKHSAPPHGNQKTNIPRSTSDASGLRNPETQQRDRFSTLRKSVMRFKPKGRPPVPTPRTKIPESVQKLPQKTRNQSQSQLQLSEQQTSRLSSSDEEYDNVIIPKARNRRYTLLIFKQTDEISKFC